jgi:hypothetical protein
MATSDDILALSARVDAVAKELPGLIGSGAAAPADPKLAAAVQTLTDSIANLEAAAKAPGGTNVSPPNPLGGISIVPASLSFLSGQAANEGLSISGGTAPYTTSIKGSLPAGLGYDVSTDTFTGVPSDPTSTPYSFSVSVIDSSNPPVTTDQAYTGSLG